MLVQVGQHVQAAQLVPLVLLRVAPRFSVRGPLVDVCERLRRPEGVALAGPIQATADGDSRILEELLEFFGCLADRERRGLRSALVKGRPT
jgi:hypothetical protein